MTARRRAFTLVEVIIGFSILAGIALVYLIFVRSSSKELQFSADHLNAVVLSQKVSEDLIEELAINPYGFETLGIAGSTDEHEVVEGRSVFFSFVEDTRAPFGKIDINSDGAITQQMQPLYDSVEKFKFKVDGRRLASSGDHEDRNLVEGKIDFFWNAQTGRGEFNTSMQMFSPVTLKKVDLGLIIDQDAIDARIPGQIFGTSQSIAEISASTGENVETLLAFGRIALITSPLSHLNMWINISQLYSGVFRFKLPANSFLFTVSPLFPLLSQISQIFNFGDSTLQALPGQDTEFTFCYV